jgi:hypothetical protein
MMTIKKDKSVEWAGEVLTGHEGFDYGPSGKPYTENQAMDSLTELTALVIELKAKVDRIENDLDYHVHLVGDLPHNI